jgi:hypothetical protein
VDLGDGFPHAHAGLGGTQRKLRRQGAQKTFIPTYLGARLIRNCESQPL